MKKHYWVVTGLLLMSVPVVSTVSKKLKNTKNNIVAISSFDFSLGSYEDIYDSYMENQNNKVKGELESVTYYAKKGSKKESLKICLNSNTLSGEDYCFLVVSVYATDGTLDYRMETTKVEYKGISYYEVEIGET